jgi:antirestriction protein ArdC
MEHRSRTFLIVLVFIVGVVALLFLSWQYASLSDQVTRLQRNATITAKNNNVVIFLRLFVDVVLKAETEVAFQKRLELEDAVRKLDDPEVLTVWNKFTNSTSEAEAQANTKDLLSLLARKIEISK